MNFHKNLPSYKLLNYVFSLENAAKKQSIPSLTSFMCLKLLGGALRTLSFAVKNSDIEPVETEGVQTGQQAVGVVPTEGQDLLVWVVFVEVVLSPVIHLVDTVRKQIVFRVCYVCWCRCLCRSACSLLFCTLYPFRCPRISLEGTGSQ